MDDKQIVKTWLPEFPGFYESWYSFEHMFGDDELENTELSEIFTDEQLNSMKITFDELKTVFQHNDSMLIDYTRYETDVCKHAVDYWNGILEPFGCAFEFDELKKPREYNFASDSVNVNLTGDFAKLSAGIIAAIREQGIANFAKYLKNRYTSCSGFISYYEPDFMYWARVCYTWQNWGDYTHEIGTLLEYAFGTGDDDSSMLEYVSGHVYAGEYFNQELFIAKVMETLEMSDDNEFVYEPKPEPCRFTLSLQF